MLTPGDPDLSDRFLTLVDPDAEPVDLDEVVAEFLLQIVRKRHSAGTPAAEPSISTTGE